MKIPEIQRDLSGHVHPKAIYHIVRQQEELIELQSQLNQCADILVSVVTTIDEVHRVNLNLKEGWEKRIKHDAKKSDEIVQSVINKPED